MDDDPLKDFREEEEPEQEDPIAEEQKGWSIAGLIEETIDETLGDKDDKKNREVSTVD